MKKLLALITVAAMVAGVAVAANVVTRQEAPQKVAPVNIVKAEMSKASVESYLPTKIERPKTSCNH